MQSEIQKYGLTCYLTAEDPRYPTLVIQGEFGDVGYSVNKSTGELRRVCLCYAHSEYECACGAWSLKDAE